MSRIRIDLEQIRQWSERLRRMEQQLSEMSSDASSLTHRVEDSIHARRNIRSRLGDAHQRLNELEGRIRALRGFIQYAGDAYGRTENELNHQASQIDGKGNPSHVTGRLARVKSSASSQAKHTAESMKVMEYTVCTRWIGRKKRIKMVFGQT